MEWTMRSSRSHYKRMKDDMNQMSLAAYPSKYHNCVVYLDRAYAWCKPGYVARMYIRLKNSKGIVPSIASPTYVTYVTKMTSILYYTILCCLFGSLSYVLLLARDNRMDIICPYRIFRNVLYPFLPSGLLRSVPLSFRFFSALVCCGLLASWML